jgi:hypothetical protein
VGLEVATANPNTAVARALTGMPHRDEELYRYLVKQLKQERS